MMICWGRRHVIARSMCSVEEAWDDIQCRLQSARSGYGCLQHRSSPCEGKSYRTCSKALCQVSILYLGNFSSRYSNVCQSTASPGTTPFPRMLAGEDTPFFDPNLHGRLRKAYRLCGRACCKHRRSGRMQLK